MISRVRLLLANHELSWGEPGVAYILGADFKYIRKWDMTP